MTTLMTPSIAVKGVACLAGCPFPFPGLPFSYRQCGWRVDRIIGEQNVRPRFLADAFYIGQKRVVLNSQPPMHRIRSFSEYQEELLRRSVQNDRLLEICLARLKNGEPLPSQWMSREVAFLGTICQNLRTRAFGFRTFVWNYAQPCRGLSSVIDCGRHCRVRWFSEDMSDPYRVDFGTVWTLFPSVELEPI